MKDFLFIGKTSICSRMSEVKWIAAWVQHDVDKRGIVYLLAKCMLM